MRHLRKSFWLSFALAALALFGPLALWTQRHAATLPSKPGFPVPGRAFVAEYGGQAAYVAHLAYWWNLFGIANNIRRADLILVGSSHTQFGLSARQLSAEFSQAAGRPVKVFNAGLGCDTPLSFDAALLERLDIRDRDIVADTFSYDYDPYTYACFSEFSAIADSVQGLFKTLAVWSRFDWDWLLDGTVPRVAIKDRQLTVGRYLNAPVTILDWNYGDVATLFTPDQGEQFPALARTSADEAQGALASGTIPLPAPLADVAATRQDRPIFTLIPFVLSPFNLPRYENVEGRLAAPDNDARSPFLAIPADSLASFDGQHLTGAARGAATDRLAASLEASGLLSSILNAP